jgi:hypothetical protein
MRLSAPAQTATIYDNSITSSSFGTGQEWTGADFALTPNIIIAESNKDGPCHGELTGQLQEPGP